MDISKSLLNSSALLDLLCAAKLLTDKQRRFIIANRSKQEHKLRRLWEDQSGGKKIAKANRADLVDVITSFKIEIGGVKNRLLTDEHIMRVVSKKLGIPFVKLDPLELDIEIVTKTIPRSFAVNQMILPFDIRNGVLQVAIYNPDNQTVLEDIERANQMKVRAYLTTKSDIKKILAEFFGFQSSITAAETHFGSPTLGSSVDIGNLEQFVNISSGQELTSSDQHIKTAVNHLFHYALEQRASDIHIEPKRNICMIRFRIDGVLHTIYNLPKVVHSAITSRIKSLARLDIAEKRRPQDGRIKIGHDNGDKEAEIRVSTIPVAFGEKVVLRILDTDVIFQDLDKLGFSQRDYIVYNSFAAAPHGIVLVTGPTGSGKSTTLYSTLKKIATPETNIITVEDPVEMVHEEFNQISIQPQIDVTFSTILRNILRQDPDIIMIGEIRDAETARYAVQAALTGHLVFSTLHTNDAVSSIIRLVDLGLEPFLIASTMLGALAQRLLRRICPECVESYEVRIGDLQKLGFPIHGDGTISLKRGKGCQMCRNTGFLGRCGVFEIFPLSEQLKKLVTSGATSSELRQVAFREGMTTLQEDAWQKVKQGVTTVEEAVRVAGGE